MEKSKFTKAISKTFGVIGKIITIGIFAFPFIWMISLSLQTQKETLTLQLFPAVPQFVNYVTAWQAGPFLLYLKNSLIIIISILILQLVVMVPSAYAFAMYEFKGKKILFGLVLLAFMTPTQITFLPVYYMMGGWGLLRTLWPQILPFVTNAFGIFLLRQYFMQIPEELIEAARLDNAGEFKLLYKVVLPQCKPAFATVLLFSFISHWNDYFWPLMMTTVTEVRPLTMGIAALKDTEGLMSYNVVMAGNMILVLPILIIYILASQNIIKAFVYSGIK